MSILWKPHWCNGHWCNVKFRYTSDYLLYQWPYQYSVCSHL